MKRIKILIALLFVFTFVLSACTKEEEDKVCPYTFDTSTQLFFTPFEC
jgi:hypothetical protein